MRAEQRGGQFHIMQGEAETRFGFVRQGDAVTMISCDDIVHSLHAGGTAFFSLVFPDRDQPRQRRLADKGVVELTSAAGYYWMRGASLCGRASVLCLHRCHGPILPASGTARPVRAGLLDAELDETPPCSAIPRRR